MGLGSHTADEGPTAPCSRPPPARLRLSGLTAAQAHDDLHTPTEALGGGGGAHLSEAHGPAGVVAGAVLCVPFGAARRAGALGWGGGGGGGGGRCGGGGGCPVPWAPAAGGQGGPYTTAAGGGGLWVGCPAASSSPRLQPPRGCVGGVGSGVLLD